MVKVSFETDLCKGCGLCVSACPQGILALAKDKLNKKGHNPAEILDQSKCTGCTSCATMCPDCVITIERER